MGWPTIQTFLFVKIPVATATQVGVSEEAKFTQGNTASTGVNENQTTGS